MTRCSWDLKASQIRSELFNDSTHVKRSQDSRRTQYSPHALNLRKATCLRPVMFSQFFFNRDWKSLNYYIKKQRPRAAGKGRITTLHKRILNTYTRILNSKVQKSLFISTSIDGIRKYTTLRSSPCLPCLKICRCSLLNLKWSGTTARATALYCVAE